MRKHTGIGVLVITLLGAYLAACSVIQATPEVQILLSTDTPLVVSPSMTPSALPSQTPAPTQTRPPTATPTFAPTATATSTPLPDGYRIVPNVVGMHYLDARQVIYHHGLTFIYRDIYNPNHPFGTIVEQVPSAGDAIPEDKFIVLYRAFDAPGMWVGEKCMPLRLTTKSGKLLYAVYLKQDERYKIQTDFAQGETTISDFRMIVLASFDNHHSDHLFFEPEWTGWYVISLGPYQTTQTELDKWPGGIPAGCLWVFPPEEG